MASRRSPCMSAPSRSSLRLVLGIVAIAGTTGCGATNDGFRGDASDSNDSSSPEATVKFGDAAPTPPLRDGGLGPIASLAIGGNHVCALGAHGSVCCWGDNTVGQLGIGTTTRTTNAVPVNALGTSVTEIAAGGAFTCAVKNDGTLWCWGANDVGEIGDGTTGSTRGVPSPTRVAALGSNVVHVTAGRGNVCAERSDGSAWCWGSNASRDLGTGSTATASGTPTQMLLPDIVGVGLGGSSSCGRRSDRTVWCWGDNTYEQLGVASPSSSPLPVQVAGLANATQIVVGDVFACAVKSDGSVWCWGDDAVGEFGGSFGPNSAKPVQVPGIANDTRRVLSAGTASMCSLNGDGTVWCWGSDTFGQVGDGVTNMSAPPTQLSVLGNGVTSISSFNVGVCAVKADGSIWCWGQYYNNTTNILTPARLSSFVCDGKSPAPIIK